MIDEMGIKEDDSANSKTEVEEECAEGDEECIKKKKIGAVKIHVQYSISLIFAYFMIQ